MAQSMTYRMKTDGFHGELFCPEQDKYPGKALICFSGSDGKFAWSRMLAQVFQTHGLTALALAPMNTVCQGFSKTKGITIMPGSAWTFHGGEVPYSSFGIDRFPLGQVLRKSLKARELTMYDLYIPLVEHPAPGAVIQAEKITGPILLVSSKMDTMWPSGPAAEQIIKRLRQYDFPYFYQHLSYDYGGHLFIPMELRLARFFRGDRGKYKELSRKARMDSLKKTLEFVARW